MKSVSALRGVALSALLCIALGCDSNHSTAHALPSKECGQELPEVDRFFEKQDDGRKVLIDYVFLSQGKYDFPGSENRSVDIDTARAIMQARIGSTNLGQSKEERAQGFSWIHKEEKWECLRLFTTEGYYYCVTHWLRR